MWNKNSKSAPCQAAAKKLSIQDALPASTRWAGRPSPGATFISRKLLLEKTGKADICGAQRGSMRRRVPFCLDSVEVGELKFYELKMVLELGFLAPERINSSLDPKLPDHLKRRIPLATAWRQLDGALDDFTNRQLLAA